MQATTSSAPDNTGAPANAQRVLRAGSGITAEFTSDGKISGSSGCNLYAGAYKVNGNNILISSLLASTMMACSQEVMDQETA